MFSTVIDVAIGMIFIYLLLSLMCSAANEIIELMLKKRAIDLERGIREMLVPGSKSGAADIVQKLYDHALINNLFDRRYENSRIASALRYIWRTHLPSYIPARSFALALMDLVTAPAPAPGAAPGAAPPPGAPPPPSGTTGSTPPPADFEITLTQPPPAPLAPNEPENPLKTLRQGIASSPLLDPVPEVRQGLIALVDAAGDDVAKARENIETWFNNSMDRVSSWYKRRTQVVILILGLFVAVAMNADTITLAKKLSTDKALRDSLVAAAQEYSKAHASAPPTPTLSSSSPTETPSEKPSPSPSNLGSGSATETPSEKPSPSPSKPAAGATPTPTPTPTPCPGPTPTPDPFPECAKTSTPNQCRYDTIVAKIPECAKKKDSDECKAKKEFWEDCRKDWNSFGCKYPRFLLTITECATNQDSDECKPKKELLEDCRKDWNSSGCKYARVLLTIPECVDEKDSFECKQKALIATIPACNECKPGQDPKSSPQCKYEFNKRQLEALNLPIGWGSVDDIQHKWPDTITGPGGWVDQFKWHLLGWLLTALAISLGAPFWFDLLNKFIVIRSAVKPHEKSPEEESKG